MRHFFPLLVLFFLALSTTQAFAMDPRLLEAIANNTSSPEQAALYRGIALKENSGKLAGNNAGMNSDGTIDYGAFGINQINHPRLAKEFGYTSVEAYRADLQVNADLAVKSAQSIYNERARGCGGSSASVKTVLCRYNGQQEDGSRITSSNPCPSTCPYAEKVLALAQIDPDKLKGETIVLEDEETGTMTVINCPDYELEEALTKAKEAYTRRMIYAPHQPGGPYEQYGVEDLEKGYCITDVLKLIDSITSAYVVVGVSGIVHKIVDVVLAQLFQIVENWINQACEYAAVTVNNVLDKLCIPIPGLPDFAAGGIPIPDREFCNGWSLTNNPVTGNMFEIKTYPVTLVPETMLGYAPGRSYGATTISPNYMLNDIADIVRDNTIVIEKK